MAAEASLPSPGESAVAAEASLPSVWTVVLHFGDPGVTARCLRSLAGIDHPAHRVLVVDNDPARTGESALAALPGTLYVPATGNLGFAGGMNLGIREALARGAAQVQLLNNDTEIVAPGYLRTLAGALCDDPALGIVGPLVWFGREGVVQPTGMYDPTLGRLLFRRSLLRGSTVEPAAGRPLPVPFEAVTGVAWLVRREVFARIGLLDEGYFLYVEETDFCRRAREAGFRSAIVPVPSLVHHHKPAPAGPFGARGVWTRRNIVRFIRLHSGWPSACAGATALAAAATWRWLTRPGVPFREYAASVRGILTPLAPGLLPRIPRLP